jgi:kynurenine formamidase
MGHRLVDLSHAVESGMTTYPGLPGPVIEAHLTRKESRTRYAPGTEFHIGRLEMVGNTGTYLDTPFHRYADGHDLAAIPLEAVAGVPGVVVDATGPAIGADAFAGVDLDGKAVLVRTGWSRHWRTPDYGGHEHPFLDAGAAELLAGAGPRLVGIDSVNIDGTADGERPAHSALLGAGIYVLEHLTGLDQLDTPGFEVFAVPVKVKELGTFPVRAFALWRT